MGSFAAALDTSIKAEIEGPNTHYDLVKLGMALAPDLSKEEYIEFVKRNLKEFAKEVVERLEDEL